MARLQSIRNHPHNATALQINPRRESKFNIFVCSFGTNSANFFFLFNSAAGNVRCWHRMLGESHRTDKLSGLRPVYTNHGTREANVESRQEHLNRYHVWQDRASMGHTHRLILRQLSRINSDLLTDSVHK